MKKKGTCEMIFSIDKKMNEVFKLDKPTFKFSTHKELDQFVNSMMLADPDLKKNFPNEWILLKSFDRAFW